MNLFKKTLGFNKNYDTIKSGIKPNGSDTNHTKSSTKQKEEVVVVNQGNKKVLVADDTNTKKITKTIQSDNWSVKSNGEIISNNGNSNTAKYFKTNFNAEVIAVINKKSNAFASGILQFFEKGKRQKLELTAPNKFQDWQSLLRKFKWNNQTYGIAYLYLRGVYAKGEAEVSDITNVYVIDNDKIDFRGTHRTGKVKILDTTGIFLDDGEFFTDGRHVWKDVNWWNILPVLDDNGNGTIVNPIPRAFFMMDKIANTIDAELSNKAVLNRAGQMVYSPKEVEEKKRVGRGSTDATIREAREKFAKNNNTTQEGMGDSILFPIPMQVDNVTYDAKKLDLQATRDDTFNNACRLYQVPLALFTTDIKYTNLEIVNNSWYSEVIIPEAYDLTERLNEFFNIEVIIDGDDRVPNGFVMEFSHLTFFQKQKDIDDSGTSTNVDGDDDTQPSNNDDNNDE